MRKLLSVMVCSTLFVGCSIYEAAHAPSPVDYKKVEVNTTRTEAIAILGFPKLTDSEGGKKTDTFEFRDGLHTASKGRIILYIAGDIFTAGLAELIFWPLEVNAFDGKLCKGTVSYNDGQHVSDYDFLILKECLCGIHL